MQSSVLYAHTVSDYFIIFMLLPARRRPQGLVVIGVCLSVCLSVRTVFVRKISQERVHGSPPNLVGGSRGWTSSVYCYYASAPNRRGH